MDKVKVSGVRWFLGNIDGKDFNTGTVFVEERLDDRRGTAKGKASTPYKLANSAAAIALSKREFPLTCEVEFERVTNGKGESETFIVDIRPMEPAAGDKFLDGSKAPLAAVK
ncbi:MAG: hypothetical protein JWQ90_2554 [Hydrocarboniphaga sp.]|uniref:hypothetical protein n=1 Tax=Hydrocarboniphaga sp. TaxID=2033016 RepID=UPI00261A87E2|nr:hypothetical protein [Hydrocarboniphaga sp.]MDB5970104.1 hypothetical protein [Hydrocarboniphaga sp.]